MNVYTSKCVCINVLIGIVKRRVKNKNQKKPSLKSITIDLAINGNQLNTCFNFNFNFNGEYRMRFKFELNEIFNK